MEVTIASSRYASRWNGKTWTTYRAEHSGITDLWGTGPDNVYALSLSGRVYRFDGSRWEQAAGPVYEEPEKMELWEGPKQEKVARGMVAF